MQEEEEIMRAKEIVFNIFNKHDWIKDHCTKDLFEDLLISLNFGLINIFKLYPLIQEILKISGSIFLVYLAYKIAFSKNVKENKK